MVEQQVPDYTSALLGEFNTKLRDLEEKHRLLKDRVLLIGENLVEMREEIGEEITKLKVFSEEAKSDILKTRETLERILEELEQKARRQELELLKKQAKMFQPLNFVTKDEINQILKK